MDVGRLGYVLVVLMEFVKFGWDLSRHGDIRVLFCVVLI